MLEIIVGKSKLENASSHTRLTIELHFTCPTVLVENMIKIC